MDLNSRKSSIKKARGYCIPGGFEALYWVYTIQTQNLVRPCRIWRGQARKDMNMETYRLLRHGRLLKE